MRSTALISTVISFALFSCFVSSPCHAVLTRKWLDHGFSTFTQGQTDDLALSSDGALSLAPKISLFDGPPRDTCIMSLVEGPDGTVFGGTCFRGRVIWKAANAATFETFVETGRLMVTCLFVQGNTLWAGTGPTGTLFEIDIAKKKIIARHESKEDYIWAILGSDTSKELLLATGPAGKLLAFESGTFTTRFDTEQRHILCLARSKTGSVLAGTSEQSLLLDLGTDGSGPLRTLFQPPQPECRSITVDQKTGTVFLCATTAPKAAASLKKPVARKPKSRSSSADKDKKKDDKSSAAAQSSNGSLGNVAAATNSTAASNSAAVANSTAASKTATSAVSTTSSTKEPATAPKDDKSSRKLTDGTASKVSPRLSAKREDAIRRFLQKVVSKVTPFVSTTPAGKKTLFDDGVAHSKHAVYAIEVDGTVTTLFSSNDAVLFSTVYSRNRIYVGSGTDGYVYRIDPHRQRVERIAKLRDTQAVALAATKAGTILVGAGNAGNVYALAPQPATTGAYTSDVKKLPHTAQFGSISYYCENEDGGDISFETRSGFTELPNESWSPWTACEGSADEHSVRSVCPPGRFFQYRATMTKTEEPHAPFRLNQVEVLYRPRNLPPRIEAVVIAPPKVELTSNRQELATAAAGKSSKKKKLEPYMRRVQWKVKDPNGDQLLAEVFLRLEGEKRWEPITEDPIPGTAIVWETLSIPDGSYRLKVVVDDSPSNFETEMKRASRVSNVFVVDNTPPQITELTAVLVKRGLLKIDGIARDRSSRIINAEFSLNADYYKALEPSDGLFDTKTESFTTQLELKGGTAARTIAVKVYDEYGNVANARIFIRQGRGSLKR